MKLSISPVFHFFGNRAIEILRFLVVNLFLFTMIRVFFYLLYVPEETEFGLIDIILAFLSGIRFDLSALAIFFIIPFFLLLLPLRSKLYIKAVNFIIGVTTFVMYTFLISDLFYYAQAGRRTSSEIFIVARNFIDVMQMGFRDFYMHIGFSIFTIIVAIILLNKLLLKKPHKEAICINVRSFLYCSGLLILFLLFEITAIRGGLQEKPLMTSTAFNNNSLFLGNLSLNGAYTIVNALYANDQMKMPSGSRENSVRVIKQMYQNKAVQFTDSQYPLMAVNNPSGKEKKVNIVIFILESFSAKDLTFFGSKTNAAPFLHKLIQEGFLFENAFATGQRSMAALPSVISSIPTLFGKLYINSSYQSNNQAGIGTIFNRRGYNTYFAYAAFNGSMGFSFYSRIAGFENVITQEHFSGFSKLSDSTWGVYDHYTFLEMHRLFSESKKPFASVIFSLHPHSPYQLPKDYRKAFPESMQRADFFNSMKYVDDSLRDFFKAAKQSDYFDNTIFIITADHVFGPRKGIERYHIPLLFYAPGIIPAGTSKRTASQTDIIPSLIDLLNLREKYISSGSSLFREGAGRAYLDMSDLMGYIKDDYLLVVSQKNPVSFYDLKNDRSMQNNLIKDQVNYQERINEMNREWMAYYYAHVYSMVNNKFIE